MAKREPKTPVKVIEPETIQTEETIAPAPAPAIPVFDFAGSIGGPFVIRGENFTEEDEVRIAGRLITPTSANRDRIKGRVPSDLEPGETLVRVGARAIVVTLVK